MLIFAEMFMGTDSAVITPDSGLSGTAKILENDVKTGGSLAITAMCSKNESRIICSLCRTGGGY